MISREDLRQLASFECQRPDELAISFYFQPSTPKDKSHREEAILAMGRAAIAGLERETGDFGDGVPAGSAPATTHQARD